MDSKMYLKHYKAPWTRFLALDQPARAAASTHNASNAKNNWWLQIFAGLCAFRFLNAILLNSHYSADETQQSLNIAYYIVSGQGHLTWEWMPEYRLRNFLHVFMLLPIFYAAKYFGFSSSALMVVLPRLQQSFFAALGDLFTYKLTKLLDGKDVAYWALAFCLLSPFNFFHSTRTLVTSIEAPLLVSSVYFWHKFLRNTQETRFLIFSCMLFGFICSLRPNSVVSIFSVVFFSSQYSWELYFRIFRVLIPTAALFILFGIFFDTTGYRLLHNDYTLPYSWSVWQFLKINVIDSKAISFGVEGPWYYFSTAIPLILGPFLPYAGLYIAYQVNFCYKCIVTRKIHRNELYRPETEQDSLFYVMVLSLAAHKEIRFTTACTYPFIIAVARTHAYFARSAKSAPWMKNLMRALVAGIVIASIIFSFLSSRILSSAVRPASDWVRNADTGNVSFVALTPCYRFPGPSYLGPRVNFRELTCEPSFFAAPPGTRKHHMDDYYRDFPNALKTWTWAKNFQLSEAPTFVAMNLGEYSAIKKDVETESLLDGYAPCSLFPKFLKNVRRLPTIINPIIILCRNGTTEKLNWNVINNYELAQMHTFRT